MEIQEFKNYIANPVKMQEEDFDKIQSLLEKYPFFHSANLLFVKAAHNINHEIYNTAINRISASVPNREILHELITLKEIKTVKVEKKTEKEESQTRKDIRERIKQRRDKRQVVKGEVLNENGKPRHESLIKEFFEPLFAKLRKSPEEYSVVIEREPATDKLPEEAVKTTGVDERERKKIEREKRMAEKRRLRAEQTSDDDKEKAKLERLQKKAEREKRMAEKKRLRAEAAEKPKEVIKKEDKTVKEGIDKKAEDVVKADKKDDAKKEKVEVSKDVEQEPSKKLKEDITAKEIKDKKVETKDPVVIKDEKIEVKKETETDKDAKKETISDEIVIESEVPEKVKKVRPERKRKIEKEIKVEEKDPFTKIITISGGDDKKETKKEISDEKIVDTDKKAEEKVDIKEKPEQIKAENKTRVREKRKEKEQIVVEEIKTDSDISDSNDEGVVIENIYDKIISSKKPKSTAGKKQPFIEISEDISGLDNEEDNSETKEAETVKSESKENKDEIEFILESKTESKEVEVVKDKEDTETVENKIAEEDTFELIDKKEDVKDEEINEHDDFDSSDIIFEVINGTENKKSEKKEVEISDSEAEKGDLKESEQKKEEETQLENQIEKVEEKKEKVEPKKTEIKEADAKETEDIKAAGDVFARIAAFKNKKKENKHDSKEGDELIQKFVDDKPTMKRKEIDDAKNEDISEESTKVKKPVITELMASIFVNQGKYDQAIEIFEKLILKNPEKKDYFAAKIEETKKLK